MATEAIPDARHEAIVCLHRAMVEVEAGDAHAALNAAHVPQPRDRSVPCRRHPDVESQARV